MSMTHGDIQPRTVHLTNEYKVIVMDNVVLFPDGREVLSKMRSNNAYRGALSPLQLAALARQDVNIRYDCYASEIWAIGLTGLSYAVGKDIFIFYDWTSMLIRENIIFEEIQRLEKLGYSKLLTNTFKNFLYLEETKRPTAEQLKPFLSGKVTQSCLASNKVLSTDHQKVVTEREVIKPLLSSIYITNSCTEDKDFESPASPVRKIDPLAFARGLNEV